MKKFNFRDSKLEKKFKKLPLYDENFKLEISQEKKAKIKELVSKIWEDEDVEEIYKAIITLIGEGCKRKTPNLKEKEKDFNLKENFSEQDLYFICFGDHIKERNGQASGNHSNLQILHNLFKKYFPKNEFPKVSVHILPHYPSPGVDRGFDVINPFQVQKTMGGWQDIKGIGEDYNLMFDFVLNHLSIKNPWYQETLKDNPEYEDFFISFDEKNPEHVEQFKEIKDKYLKLIYRPRAHDLFVKVQKADGSYTHSLMHFSLVQPDVNYHNPRVFLKMAETLIFFIIQGARTLRLDAAGYIWKEWGTSCLHHPKAHYLVELFRAVSDLFSPATVLLIEAMEPPQDGKRYLSNQETKKAHMSYNFVPCGLIPYTIIHEDAEKFQNALAVFENDRDDTAQAVVCGKTHDGSSVNACRKPRTAEGEAILTEEQINAIGDYYRKMGLQELKRRAKLPADNRYYVASDYQEQFKKKHGRDIKYRNFKAITDKDGKTSKIIYEIVSTYASLFEGDPDKIVNALAMAMPIKGVPFMYITAIFAALNDYDYYLVTGGTRQLNEGRLLIEEIEKDLNNKESLTCKVFTRMQKLIKIRTSESAFHPQGEMLNIDDSNKAIFTFLRVSLNKKERILVMQNVSKRVQRSKIQPDAIGVDRDVVLIDLISDQEHEVKRGKKIKLDLEPYQIMWLKY